MTVTEYAAKCTRDGLEPLSAGERDELRSLFNRAARQDANVPSTSTIVGNAIARSSFKQSNESDPCGRSLSAPRFPWMESCRRLVGHGRTPPRASSSAAG